MRNVRIAVIVFCILSLGLFGAGIIREKQNEDPTKPVITSDRDTLEVSVNYDESDLLEGLTASDERDGDLTDEILPGEFSQFIEKGLCNLSYVVFDSSNQAGTLSRKVRFTDYESPRFTLNQPLVFTTAQTDNNALNRIGARDDLDGDISIQVKQTASTINYSKEGNYTIDVEVTNSFGDVEKQTLPVHVINVPNQELQITLTQNLIYIKPGESFVPTDYIESCTDWNGNEISTSLVSVSSEVNTQEEGCYEVHYEASNNDLNGETWMTVIVRS